VILINKKSYQEGRGLKIIMLISYFITVN